MDGLPVNGRESSLYLRCGESVLPLKRPYSVAYGADGTMQIEEFGVGFPPGTSQTEVERGLIRRYMNLEHKAAPGALTSDELDVWKGICEVVDRDAVARARAETTPTRMLGEVIEDATGARGIRWVSGLELPIPQEAIRAVEVLNVGEWFEADVYWRGDGAVRALSNVDTRFDYRIATDAEIDAFFRGR